jgi:hypothetical protein
MQHLLLNEDIININTKNFGDIHKKLAEYRTSKTTRPHTIDCKEFDNVFIISDIHADFPKFISTLHLNNLIKLPNDMDPYNKKDIYDPKIITETTWTGGNKTLLLILGDLVDGYRYNDVDDTKGTFEILIHIFLHNMRILANANSSEVIFTLGNHDYISIYNDNMEINSKYTYFNSYVHKSAKQYYIDNDTRRKYLLPFYTNCYYLFVSFQNEGKDEIICLHAGLHSPGRARFSPGQKYDLDSYKKLQTDIDVNNVNNVMEYNNGDNVLFTRAIDENNNTVCLAAYDD